MYHELSLIGCFTRITVNVPRIVINCLGDIASGCRWLQQPCHACMGRCGCGHLFPSFCLETKGPKIQGRHHRSQRTKRALPRHVGQARAPYPVDHRHSRTRHKDRKQHDNGQHPRPLPSWRFRLCGMRRSAIPYALGTHSCRRFASSRGGTTKRSIYDRFM